MDNNINESVKIEASEAPKKTENITTESKPVHPKERRHVKDEKPKKKEERGVEQVLRSLVSIENSDEKLSAMCKKYSEVIDENRKLQLALKQTEKKVQMIQREKDQLQTERSKSVLTRSRLESLCRELQRQNKAVKEESLLKLREEEEKRKEVSAKFQSTLGELTALMSQNNEKNTKLYEDNMEMSKNFKSLCEQVELREQQFEKIHQQMKLEIQLAEAKLAKVTLEMTAEKEALLNEKKQLLGKLSEYQLRLKEMQAQEVGLRSQISMYTDKYDEFQNALTKSNQVFGGFNEEMEKMSKKIHKLEKETGLWKQRWEKSHQALLEMAADKQTRDAEIEGLNRKRLLLLELCKAFQQERTTLIMQLKEKTLESNSTQNETNDNTKSTEQIDNFTKVSEKLGNNLSEAQESLVQDIAAQEAKNKDTNVKPKTENPPAKVESTKRKEKKKRGNDNSSEAKKEPKKDVQESETIIENKPNLVQEEGVKENKNNKDNKSVSNQELENKPEVSNIQENNQEPTNQEVKNNKETPTSQESLSNKETKCTEESKEIEEVKNEDVDTKLEDKLKEAVDSEKSEEICVSNSERTANQEPVKVELPQDDKTENIVLEEIKKEVEQLSEDLQKIELSDKKENDDKSISESHQIEESANVKDSNDFQKSELVSEKTETENEETKSSACPNAAKKGKETKKKKK